MHTSTNINTVGELVQQTDWYRELDDHSPSTTPQFQRPNIGPLGEMTDEQSNRPTQLRRLNDPVIRFMGVDVYW